MYLNLIVCQKTTPTFSRVRVEFYEEAILYFVSWWILWAVQVRSLIHFGDASHKGFPQGSCLGVKFLHAVVAFDQRHSQNDLALEFKVV